MTPKAPGRVGTEPVLTAKALSFSFGEQEVFTNLNLVLRRGGHSAILGASGSGKSTLLRVLAGLLSPQSGEVIFGSGDAMSDLTSVRVGYVFQDLRLFPNLTAIQNVTVGLSGFHDEACELMDDLSISDLRNRKPAYMSQGERQRTAVARALIRKPTILLLDEPSSALDASSRKLLIAVLSKYNAECGVSYLSVSHDLGYVARTADTVYQLELGLLKTLRKEQLDIVNQFRFL